MAEGYHFGQANPVEHFLDQKTKLFAEKIHSYKTLFCSFCGIVLFNKKIHAFEVDKELQSETNILLFKHFFYSLTKVSLDQSNQRTKSPHPSDLCSVIHRGQNVSIFNFFAGTSLKKHYPEILFRQKLKHIKFPTRKSSVSLFI